jgi:2-polyprenyl-3-methyl-5-hydroxy-6-metoxy-1,4-benzoquinol methylase
MTDGTVMSYFDRVAPSWDEHYARSRLFRARYLTFEKAVSQYGAGSRRALDYGCGSGVLTGILQKACELVVATDLSTSMVDITRRKYAECPNVQVSRIDAVPRMQFDLVICSSVVEYVDDPDDFVAALAAHLRPDGVLLMTFSNKFGPLQILGRHLVFRFKRDPHTNFVRSLHSRHSILDLIRKNHLECVELSTPIGLPVFTTLGLGELHFLVARKNV